MHHRHRLEGLPELEELVRQHLGKKGPPWPIETLCLYLRERGKDNDSEELVRRIDLDGEDPSFPDGLPTDPDDLARALTRVLRTEIEGNLDPDAPMVWRVKLFGPRNSYRSSRTVLARLPDAESPAAPLVTTQAVNLMENIDDAAIAQRVAVNGDIHNHYNRLVKLLFSGVENFVQVANSHMEQLNSNAQVQYRHAEALTRTALQERQAEFSEKRAELTSKADATLKSQAMDKAISVGRDLVGAVLMEKGVDPAMAEMLALLQSNPRTGPLLRNPNLKQALADPNVMNILAEILEAAATPPPSPQPE